MTVKSINRNSGIRGVLVEVVIDWPAHGERTYYKWSKGRGWNNSEGIDSSAALSNELNKIVRRAA